MLSILAKHPTARHHHARAGGLLMLAMRHRSSLTPSILLNEQIKKQKKKEAALKHEREKEASVSKEVELRWKAQTELEERLARHTPTPSATTQSTERQQQEGLSGGSESDADQARSTIAAIQLRKFTHGVTSKSITPSEFLARTSHVGSALPVFSDSEKLRSPAQLREAVEKRMVVWQKEGSAYKPTSQQLQFANRFFRLPAEYVTSTDNILAYGPPQVFPEIVVIGRSNVGKSTLINALFNSKTLVKTSSKPGHTKALNFFSVARRLMVIDCPGYGYKAQPEWMDNLGALFATRQDTVKLVCLLIDPSHGIKSTDLEVMALLDALKVRFQVVLTKCDRVEKDVSTRILNATEVIVRTTKFCLPFPFPVSVRQNKGLGVLRHSLLAAAEVDESNWRLVQSSLASATIKSMYGSVYFDDTKEGKGKKPKSEQAATGGAAADDGYGEGEEAQEEDGEANEAEEEAEEDDDDDDLEQLVVSRKAAAKRRAVLDESEVLEDPADDSLTESELRSQIEEVRAKLEGLKLKSWDRISK